MQRFNKTVREQPQDLAGLAPFLWKGLPTKVVSGSGAVAAIEAEVAEEGMSRVLLVMGKRTAASSVGQLVRSLIGKRLRAVFDEVPPHSGEATVAAGVALARGEGIDGLVAVGGGSASDTAKAIAIVLAENGRIADHANVFHPPDRYVQQKLDQPKLPIIVVPTTASAAEVTPGLGIRAEDGHKLVFWDHNVVPRTIILDEEVVLGTPSGILASTAMNAFAHCVEGHYSRVGNPISSALALHAARMLATALPDMVREPAMAAHRGAVMAAAHLSGLVIANARVGLHHAICHGLGSYGGLSHGDANAIMLPHVMEYNSRVAAGALGAIAEAMGEDVRGLDAGQAAGKAIEAVRKLQHATGVPTRLRDVGFDRDRIAPIAAMTLSDRGSYFNPIVAPPQADIEAVIGAAW